MDGPPGSPPAFLSSFKNLRTAGLKKQEEYTGYRHKENITVCDSRSKPTLAKQPSRSNGAVYLSAPPVEFYPFDQEYLERLQAGDKATHEHFARYFTDLLRIKLRGRGVPADDVKDLLQETFARVFMSIRMKEIRQPDRLGAFVNATCTNVMREYFRNRSRNQCVDLEEVDVQDGRADLEANMISRERDKSVRAVLRKLPAKDSTLLRALLQDRDKAEICKELGVERGYLRVLTHRAIHNFREHYKSKKA